MVWYCEQQNKSVLCPAPGNKRLNGVVNSPTPKKVHYLGTISGAGTCLFSPSLLPLFLTFHLAVESVETSPVIRGETIITTDNDDLGTQ